MGSRAGPFPGGIMPIDPFPLCVGLGPVAMYLLLLGAINLSRHSLLVSGVRDAAALALAVSGLVVIGPMELFYPYQSAIRLGPKVWLLLLALYVMCVLLWLLLLRPRLIIYNISADKLRPILADAVNQFDGDARWAGDSLAIPGLGVQLYIDAFATFRSVSLVSAGGLQSHAGWRRLEGALRAALAREETGRNPRGLILFVAGLLCVGGIVAAIANDPEAVARSLLNVAHSVLRMFDSTAYPP
jgi:hypothetical protein